MVSGIMGSGAGTTSYSENIGAMALTRVGSRVVVQVGAVAAIVIACSGKLIAVVASLPTAMAGGAYCVLFALIAAIGLSNLQYINLNSERNLFIVGFSIFNSMSIAGPAGYFKSQPSNPFGSSNMADIALSVFSSPILVVLMLSMFLDNTIRGTRKERGLLIWARMRDADVNNDPGKQAAPVNSSELGRRRVGDNEGHTSQLRACKKNLYFYQM
jgi:solute carrier family 23 (nucleobase transporter), member 1